MEENNSNQKCVIEHLDINGNKYLVADNCFYQKEHDEFKDFLYKLTQEPNQYLFHLNKSSYRFNNEYVYFKQINTGLLKKFKYLPICSISAKTRKIKDEDVTTLVWSWNNISPGINYNPELLEKIKILKKYISQDFKLQNYGLVFKKSKFKDTQDSAIYQGLIYTSWLCKKLDGFKIFSNFSSAGEPVNLNSQEVNYYGVKEIFRPYVFVILYE